ncbi:hypothetical protein JW758_05400 [Candidatus Peregrinibacteria bacterium]|nr:hypothetical protein [Candidatus Peregrinibacteria bacterium]
MKKIFSIILGSIILMPFWVADAFGISVTDFEHEVYRPENLPAGRLGDATPETKINDILGFATDLILYASGSVAVLMLIVGGIRYISSLGNQEAMEGAKKTIKFAAIGLFAVILAYAVVTNVIDLIFRATT